MKRLVLFSLVFVMLCGCSSIPGTNLVEPGSRNSFNRSSPRSEEEIQLVFQQSYGAITQLYQRARRKDPTLKGKVVFEIAIEPSGAVSACKVLSSEMNEPALLEKIVDKIKTINFGSKDQPAMTTNLPLSFSLD